MPAPELIGPNTYYIAAPEYGVNAFTAFWSTYHQVRAPYVKMLFQEKLRRADPTERLALQVEVEKMKTELTIANRRLQGEFAAADASVRNQRLRTFTSMVETETQGETQKDVARINARAGVARAETTAAGEVGAQGRLTGQKQQDVNTLNDMLSISLNDMVRASENGDAQGVVDAQEKVRTEIEAFKGKAFTRPERVNVGDQVTALVSNVFRANPGMDDVDKQEMLNLVSQVTQGEAGTPPPADLYMGGATDIEGATTRTLSALGMTEEELQQLMTGTQPSAGPRATVPGSGASGRRLDELYERLGEKPPPVRMPTTPFSPVWKNLRQVRTGRKRALEIAEEKPDSPIGQVVVAGRKGRRALARKVRREDRKVRREDERGLDEFVPLSDEDITEIVEPTPEVSGPLVEKIPDPPPPTALELAVRAGYDPSNAAGLTPEEWLAVRANAAGHTGSWRKKE